MSREELIRKALERAPKPTPAELAEIRSALPPVVAR